MPRSLAIGNGSVLATLDAHLQLRDLYFPYVGMEDHTAYGDLHRTGVWVEGKGFSWFDDPQWKIQIRYTPETLVGNSVLLNEQLGIELTVKDCVHPVHNILVRHFVVRMLDGEEREVRMFFHHDLHIYGDKQKDTAFYEPYTNTVIHYRQKRYFLIGGNTSHPTECKTGAVLKAYQSVLHSTEHMESCGITGYSIGKSDYQGLEGTWRDAEDGELAGTTIDQGSVDSTVGIYCRVPQGKEATVSLWMCFGKTLDDVIDLHQVTLRESPEELLSNCHNYWKSWVNKSHRKFDDLEDSLVDLYKRSLMLIRAHTDNNGAIIAAADADIMVFNRDTYTYMWPRDGAFVSMALDRARYIEVTRRFFRFCERVQTPDGYLLHKYNPDGSVGSSWHPWMRDNEAQLPIQEDETALVIYALWKHFQYNQDFEFLQEMYENFIKDAAKFLSEFCEEESGLPLASYDPWEEHRGIFTYTTACTVAGLHAAAQISHILGHYKHSARYQDAADAMKQAMLFHLYDENEQRFLKKIQRKDGQTIESDSTIDASVSVIWKLGVLSVNDPRVISTMQQVEDHLTVRTSVGGIARYTNDYYHSKVPSSHEVPGNPWIITTLWNAQWYIARAKSLEDLEPVKDALRWVQRHASDAGILAEQLHPHTGEPLSVAPLVWSHATYVETVLMLLERMEFLKD